MLNIEVDMRLQVAAKVVGRLRGEEFPHFGAACGTRNAWVRRHYTACGGYSGRRNVTRNESQFFRY